MEEKLFINSRYIKGNTKAPMYVNHNGVIKRYVPSPFTKRDALRSGIWYSVDELPKEMRDTIDIDMAITQEDLLKHFRKVASKKSGLPSVYATNEKLKFHLTDDTLLLPIVDNFLPYDGINAYTIIEKDGSPQLKAILVNYDCHWSELYTGETKYGNNVFCLAQDLPKDVQEKFAECFITLSQALDYLSQTKGDGEKTL